MIIVTGSVTARSEDIERLKQASADHVIRSRTEQGCLRHSVLIDCEDPRRLFFYEEWADYDALVAHFAQPGSADYIAVVRELGQPSLLVDVDRDKIARYGINVADVEAVISAAVGGVIGAMVTLRRSNMWEFMDRLVTLALPRTRDFRGVSTKSFDGRGNYTLGLKDQLIFPEIDYNKVEKTKGMNICITTTARTDAEGQALLKHMGMPFSK